MKDNKRIGIMDIGSNSIRLVIFETNKNGGYRALHESKESARLSEHIQEDGTLSTKAMESVASILIQYHRICETYQVHDIRVGATAAIRNATNSEAIAALLHTKTGLKIDVLSGEEEAYFGFLGVINSLDVEDGLLIDIGGGSTEITLFENRKLLHSISLPFGAVNTNLKFGKKSGDWQEDQMEALVSYVQNALENHPWIASKPNLTMIGLGGTIRALGKMDQKNRKYSLPSTHHYAMGKETIVDYYKTLPLIPLEQRKRIPGLSKQRTDLIVPGLIIFHTVFKFAQAKECMISGAGLREGMLHHWLRPEQPVEENLAVSTVESILGFESNLLRPHLEHVYKMATMLYKKLENNYEYEDEDEVSHKKLLYVSSMLYKIGTRINYYQFETHTMYWLLNAPLRGFSHREIVLSSLISSYNTKSRKQKLSIPYKDILLASDEDLIHRLGSLLKLCTAMDQSETQIIDHATAEYDQGILTLNLHSSGEAILEKREIESAAKVFTKSWDVKLQIHYSSTC
ncbi:Ppx/GppA phosphatase family protein [Paenibacillus pini]|uniref:Exopolyphosphatase n=1 Tax=Paenibacillus pini JCM 16418 TaxID=1236976 RepID=W7YYH0_9BACL|nr:Ppx/GppA phosphatase family protein [Paenibacillus pini]GAF07494.1 exopolyphosphatase [Paenibacillus pini JCM 16418]